LAAPRPAAVSSVNREDNGMPPITGLVAQLKHSSYRHLGEPDELDPKILTIRCS
jgi:hypothetical protein